MKQRISALLLVFSLIIGLFPGLFSLPVHAASDSEPKPIVANACQHGPKNDAPVGYSARPSFDGYLIELTPQRVTDTFRYLDEMYVEKHPEAALLVNTGTEKDRADLKALAKRITAGCTTDTAKANAIDSWLRYNIFYEIDSSAYASDTMYDGIGNCLSYANLMQFLLRSLGIPAVVGDGWRGDMKTSTIDLFNHEGHAWCFVRLGGEWVMYDPLWLEGGTTDRDYMAKYIYFDTVEFVSPASDRENLPPETYDKPKVYHNDGTVFIWNEYLDNTLGTLSYYVNNQCYVFVTNQCEPETGISDGWYYIHSDYDKRKMERGDVYCDSWISYGDYATGNAMSIGYAHANGMHIDGAVMTLDGQDYLMNGNQSFPILADKDDYSIMYGLFTLKEGFTGEFLGLPWQNSNTPGCRVTWENLNPEVATVDSNNHITCHDEGYAEFIINLERLENSGYYTLMGMTRLSIQVSNDVRILPEESNTPPEAPTVNITNVSSTGKIKLSWKAVDGAAEYKVYRSTSKNGTYKRLTTVTGTSVTNNSAVAGTQYYYYVVAVSESGVASEKSNIVTRTCDLPRPELKISVVASTGKLKLRWDAIDGATKYEVHRSTDGGKTYSLLKTVTGTSLTNTSITAGNKYYYKVKAIHSKSSANSAFSSAKYGTCDLPRPVVKISVVSSTGKLKLRWDAIDGAAKYEVYRSTDGGKTYSLLKTTTGTSLTNTSITAGNKYYYKVKAIHSNSNANSAYSSARYGTCDLARPTAQVSLNSEGKPVVSWGEVAGAEKYIMYIYDADGNQLSSHSTTNLQLTHVGADKGETYSYRVMAVHSNTSANSAKSNTVSITAN